MDETAVRIGLIERLSHDVGGDRRFLGVLVDIALIHAKKQQDYGVELDPFANIRASQEFGVSPWLGAVVRANDKVSRLKTYARTLALANESVKDSLLDLATYAAIALVLFEEEEASAPVCKFQFEATNAMTGMTMVATCSLVRAHGGACVDEEWGVTENLEIVGDK